MINIRTGYELLWFRLLNAASRMASLFIAILLMCACSSVPTRLRNDLPEATYYVHPFNVGKKGSRATFEVEAVYCNAHEIRFGLVLSNESRRTLSDLSNKIPYAATRWPYADILEMPQVKLIITNTKTGQIIQNTNNDVFGTYAWNAVHLFTRRIASIEKPGIYRIEVQALKSVALFDNDLNNIEISIYSKIEKVGAEKCTN